MSERKPSTREGIAFVALQLYRENLDNLIGIARRLNCNDEVKSLEARYAITRDMQEGLKGFTVFGTYFGERPVAGAAWRPERFADHVEEAKTWQEAEEIVLKKRNYNVTIAATLAGKHYVEDEQ